jgi:hypothetical protein
VTLLTLTPTQQPRTGSGVPVNLSALLTAGALGSDTGVTFANSGHEVLYVELTSTTTTISVEVGTLIEGEPVSSIPVTPVVSAINVIGPFPADEDQPGGYVTVTFGTAANVTGVALLQNVGAV